MFPERQNGPHRDWKYEVEYLDNIFKQGAAYTVGKVNGDHWLLYITTPQNASDTTSNSPTRSSFTSKFPDYTIEILMSDLSPMARQPFYAPSLSSSETPSSHAEALSSSLGITNIFPPERTTLDGYTFSPCGYSSNALIRWGDASSDAAMSHGGEGYYTIHVTPEEGWSYASFECNVPLSHSTDPSDNETIPNLKTLIQRVVRVFQPGRLSLTLFISSEDDNGEKETAVEAAQKAFRAALSRPSADKTGGQAPGDERSYRRTDKINYEFAGYDLAFASFELITN